jgi:hypothetical protein
MSIAQAALQVPASGSGRMVEATHYFHWGVVQISLANLLVIAAMVVIFILALVLPFPHGSADRESGDPDADR